MSLHIRKRAYRPDHRHPLSHSDGLPSVIKAVVVVSVLPIALAVAIILSIRADLAPDHVARQPHQPDHCVLFGPPAPSLVVSEPAPHHLCLH